MLKTYQNKQIIFRHKIFYLKHLVLTDIHYPTANLLAYSIYLEQEAIAEALHHFTVHHSSRSKTTKSIQNFTKLQMPASEISKPHPFFFLSHWPLGDTRTNVIKSKLFQEYISISFHTKLPLLLQQQTSTVKCLKEGLLEQNWYQWALMQEEHGAVSVMTAGYLVWPHHAAAL